MISTKNGTKFYLGNKPVTAMYQGNNLVYSGVSKDALILFAATVGDNTLHTTHDIGVNDCIIDWGDGSTTPVPVDGGNVIHNYAVAGDYKIKISGTAFSGFHVNNQSGKEKYKELISYGKWDNLLSISSSFMGCSNLTKITKGALDGLVNLEDAGSCFNGTGITEIPTGLFDKCPNIIYFGNTFNGCSLLTTIPANLFKFNVNANYFNSVFKDCSSIISIPSGLFDTNVQAHAFGQAFYCAYSLETIPPDLFKYNLQANDFAQTFYYCENLVLRNDIFGTDYATRFNGKTVSFVYTFNREKAPLSTQGEAPELWNFAGLTAMNTADCFSGDGNNRASLSNYSSVPIGWGGFESIDAQITFEASIGINMLHIRPMSSGNLGIIDWGDGQKTILPVDGGNVIHSYAASGTKTISIVGSKFSGFYVNYQAGCEKYMSLITLGKWKTDKITSLSSSFYGCNNLMSISEGALQYAVLATSAEKMFEGCVDLVNIPPNLFANAISITNFRRTFYACTYLVYRLDIFGTDYANRFNGKTVIFEETFRREGIRLFSTKAIVPAMWNFTGMTPILHSQCFYGYGNTKLSIDGAELIPIEWGGFPHEDASILFAATAGVNTLHIRVETLGNNCYIDWGDGSMSSMPLNGGNVNHTYASAGDKVIKIIGASFTGFYVNYQTGATKYKTLYSYGRWAYNTLYTIGSDFYGCSSLTSVQSDAFKYWPSTSAANTMFKNTALSSIPTDLFRYMPGVTSFYETFMNTLITAIPTDLFRYNTVVTSFRGCFRNSKIVTIPADLFRYNLLVSNFSYVFAEMTTLINIPADLFRYNTDVVDFSYAFFSATNIILRSDIFGIDYATRFNGKTVNFTYAFQRIGAAIIFATAGVAPALWSFTGLTATKTSCFSGELNSLESISNYASIPVEWGGYPSIPASIVFAATVGDNTLHIRGTASGNHGVIDWGDGSKSILPTGGGNVTHTYAAAGDKTITIRGDKFSGFYVNNQTGKEKYKTLISFGSWKTNMYLTTIAYGFYGCTGLTSISADALRYLPNVTAFTYLFNGCTSITAVDANLFRYNTSATNLSGIFKDCTGLLALPTDFFRYNTLVTDMSAVFSGCNKITSIPTYFFRYNTAVTLFSEVFRGCTALTSIPPEIFHFNVNATYLNGVFYGCTGLTTIPANLFMYNIKTVSFFATFQGCAYITAIPVDCFRYNTLVTDLSYAFYGCTRLNTISADVFRYNTAVTNFGYTFALCNAIASVAANLFQYNINVTSFSGTFMQCGVLTTIPAALFQYNIKVTSFSYVFWNSGLTAIPQDLFRYNTLVTDFSQAFRYCYMIVSVGDNIFLYNTLATNFMYTFDSCTRVVLRTNMFGLDYANRFAGKTMFFTGMFQRTGWSGTAGTAPTLWIFTFGAVTSTLCFAGAGNSATSLTNYASIPAAWK